MIILDNFNMLGTTAIISSEDIMKWDNRYNAISRKFDLEKTVSILKGVDCIIIITSMGLQSIPKEIRDLLGDAVTPKARIYRFRVKS